MMFFHQRDKVRRFVPGQGGFREVGICGIEMFRPAMDIGEVAAASARDQDFLARAIGPFQNGDASFASKASLLQWAYVAVYDSGFLNIPNVFALASFFGGF